MQRKKLIIIGLVVLGIILLIVGILYTKSRTGEDADLYGQEVRVADPIDITMDFYNAWLEMTKSTSTDPYTSGLATEKILGTELRTWLTNREAQMGVDPVLCQSVIPARVTGRIVSEQEAEVQVLVVPKEKELTGQSVFTLKRYNDGWFIKDISCAPGEFDHPREFSFEKEGYLLKNVPPPFDPQHWHIVFEHNGELGHVAPLFFDAESSCASIDKSEAVCAPDQFREGTKIHASGQMTEGGVEVKRLKFVE